MGLESSTHPNQAGTAQVWEGFLTSVLSLPRELVSRLHQRGVQVFLVSGGFQSIVEHVALQLNIPTANVFANRLKFYFNGESPSHLLSLLSYGICCFQLADVGLQALSCCQSSQLHRGKSQNLTKNPLRAHSM